MLYHLPADQIDEPYEQTPLRPEVDYCRLFLVAVQQSATASDHRRYSHLVPTVTRFNYGGRLITLPHLLNLKEYDANGTTLSVLNHPLTPPFPYHGGPIQLQSGLYSIPSSPDITDWLHTLEEFSSLLMAGELSKTLHVAEPLSRGIEYLFAHREVHEM
jgi:hypothetical protein